jgi:hypothetical protein
MTHVNTSISFTVWWDPDSNSDRIRLLSGDPRFTIEGGTGPGLQFAVSGNRAHADYNPRQFNRLARFLQDQGLPAPAEVPIESRRLHDRLDLLT